MAKPVTIKGTAFRLFLGDGATPEVFSALCGLTTKGINFQTNTNESFVPDCDNPDDPAWREITKSGKFATITGSGIMDAVGAFPRYRDAYDSADSVNMQVRMGASGAFLGGYWEGAFMLTQFNVTGNDGDKVNVEITMESDGEVTWVPTP